MRFTECDCGSAGGCKVCRIYWSDDDTDGNEESDYLSPELHEEKFLDPSLEAFYEKKGYK